ENDRLRPEHDEASLFAPVADGAADPVSVGEQLRHRAFHVDVKAHLDSAVLQRADHLEPGAVAHVAEPLERVAAEGPLEDVAIGGESEKPQIVDLAARERADVEVRETDPDEAQPGEQTVPLVQRARPSPEAVARAARGRTGEAVDLPSREMPQRMTGKRVERQK